ncbi:hypothetical protein BXU06_07405 [Aquaspirillum sp. LM1]|uniref:CRISPR system precrRNA processing endoribonuclease RAMP protein Cas6 n=1 Tax=Aquaspirillum sp. LM1 TaxID=1938604 RepID=UPI0009838E38|nr:CRISPR system precrRNA processing endoribonuclease RAMP protein Cas6 [Aquaspirillum sp. LM1]AQR64911.1 hypothetical protein BXU06_07405 [Aquaspirillum sp. LM1]
MRFLPSAAPAETGLHCLPVQLGCVSDSLRLDDFAGPLWRSGFGVALKRQLPALFDLLFAEQARLGRLYALHTPTAPVLPGQPFALGFTLFGPASAHAQLCVQAFAALGALGLGQGRGLFRVESASVAGAPAPFWQASHGLTAWPQTLPAAHWLSRRRPARGLRLHLRSPLRIKDNNQLCLSLNAPQLVRRLHTRLGQLCDAAGEPFPLSEAELAAQRQAADALQLGQAQLSWRNIARRSSRSQQHMVFGGLTGLLELHGELAPLSGLLALGEVLQLGGKTTFGFGCLHAEWLD